MPTPDISVRLTSEDPRSFRLAVQVRAGDGETRHEVTLARDQLARLAPRQTAEVFVRRCFEFLLEREAKESILAQFDVSIIARYFPDFEATITVRRDHP